VSRVLCIDTAERQVRLETFENGRCLASVRPESRHHVRDLTVHLRKLIAETSWNWPSIAAVGVNTGPGTFTGIRVGLAVAKAICYAHRIDLVGVDMFDCLAQGSREEWFWQSEDAGLTVALEGQLQTVLLARYCRDGDTIRRVSLVSVPHTELAKQIEPSLPIIGLFNRFQNYLPTSARIISHSPWEEWRPGIGGVVLQRVAAGRFDDPMTIEPFYVRPSSAEEKWDRRSN